MQQIWGPGQAANILLTAQKRLIRPSYAQTQGYPYACFLDPSLRNSDGSLNTPVIGTYDGYTYTANPYTYENSLIPALVMTKTNNGESVMPHNGGTSVPFGLLDQWVGGLLDNVGPMNEISCWMGVDSVYDLLAPAWNDTQVASTYAAAGVGSPVPLYAQTDGRLGSTQGGSQLVVAYVMNRVSSAVLTIKLAI